MFDESQPSTPTQAIVALAPLEPEWQPIFHASNQVVLYNPTSHALSVTNSSAPHHLEASSSCPYCHRPIPSGFAGHSFAENFHLRSNSGSHSRASNYFQLLAAANQTSLRTSSPPLPSGRDNHHETFPREAMAEGYFQAFFQEEYRLGMGANGSVYLCQHVLDGQPLGHFAVKKIAVGESHSYLINILREIRLLESLHHQNIITYHHAWLESYQFSAFGPKVPTLHVLMQWAEGGSLDDFIALRLGHTSRLPHIQSSPADDDPTPSARIRAFRAMKRAPPEERERLRREMEERIDNGGSRRSLKAVHLLSAEEIQSLFRDVTHGLAFLHDRSILHLDLKPGNVLLTWDEGKLIPRAMLSDFGTSRDMIQSSGSRSGNTGTLEYASPESLPAPLTGALRQIDSKSDMWSLGMILHKMLFFKLPYRYATDGEASANDDADKMDKLEEEISGYSGFRSTSALVTSFESRHLPRSFLVLLEGLLNITPSQRPSSERILSAMRKGQFDPMVPSTPPTGGSLIPLRRKPDVPDVVQDGHFLPDIPPTPTEPTEGDTAAELDSNNSMLRIFPLISDRRLDAVNSFIARIIPLHWRLPRLAWVSSLKACIFAAKTLSVVPMWPSRPVLVAILGLLAVLDTMLDSLEVTLVLGVLHLVIIRRS